MAENPENGQEKTFEATEAKLRKAREQGDVPQSQEVTALAVYCGFAVGILALGVGTADTLLTRFSSILEYPDRTGELMLQTSTGSELGWGIAGAFAPIIFCLAAAILLAMFAQRSITFAPEKLKPKLSKISPISNAKQKYGRDGMAEFAKRAVKLGIITATAIIYLIRLASQVAFEIGRPEAYLFPKLVTETLLLLGWMIAATLMIAAVDLPFVQWSHRLKQMMTRDEMKEDQKNTDGDPHMKSMRRQRAREISQSSQLADVATANVIIVNPTHYSVALKWDRLSGSAPVCVAKGTDHFALAIRQRAKENDILIHSDPPCARALHATVEVGDEIRPEHYAAVAAAIHLADQLSKRGSY